MDFYNIVTKQTKEGMEVYLDFNVSKSKDLMIRGGSFYAVWDEEQGLWSTDEYDVQRLIDQDLKSFVEKNVPEGVKCNTKYLRSFNSNSWSQFRRFISNISDSSVQLDANLTFANTDVKKSDYVSRRLPYSLSSGDFSAWDELVGTLYSVEERAKIEWAIGSVISGDSKKIQKFLVIYGPMGTGKSTILNVVQNLFQGYVTTFEAKALGANGNSFATEVFKNNPLVAIQHDGDLSKVEDNTKLNSIIAHEDMTMNEKYKASYTARVNAFLFMGTNKPVKISDAKSGLIRRLIDVHPTGVIIPANHYNTLVSQLDFELGAIAQRCLDVYLSMGKNYYNSYRPVEMMFQTDVFYNFIEANYDLFKKQDSASLKQAYGLYKEYCNESGITIVLPMYKIREELRNYFDHFQDRVRIDEAIVRSFYTGFNANKFKAQDKEDKAFKLVLEETESLLDEEFAKQPAQYGNAAGTPKKKWEAVTTTLDAIDTGKLHFVKVPENHIVIDFDLKEINGTKSLERNLEAASIWPATYAEFSKSGSGIHLHYTYEGDVSELNPVYSDGIEIKVYPGDASLRRLLTKCNSVPISKISGGLPLREKKMLDTQVIQSEKGLRDLIGRNLNKDIHPATKPSIDFIYKILDDAYTSGMTYDVTDMRSKIMVFANNSSNQASDCLKVVRKMKFASEVPVENVSKPRDERLVIFDTEVFKNLFVICWKYRGDDNVVRMINPTPQQVEGLFDMKLVGFNNRRYDNHILYARSLGYSNAELFEMSMKIITKQGNPFFGVAYNLSYADVLDFSSIKQSLKKFQVQLGLRHKEFNFPEDGMVDESLWMEIVEYCVNDVTSTEAVLEDRWQDFVARQILADLSNLSTNDTTAKHTAKIIFGDDKNPQGKFIYTDLSKEFPGYVFDKGVSTYRDETVGEGGYIHAEPGMYDNVAVLDVASMHPTSIEILNLFGTEYTKKFSELKKARVAIKHRDYELAKTYLDGKLDKYLVDDEDDTKALAYALKIVINIVYGLTSAKFNNPFRDNRNMDNIAAKRGALFMIDLKQAVRDQGFVVAHIKTDSIKIPDATPEIIDFVIKFGEKYGYEFEHEVTYDKLCLVNDAVYIAREGDKWTAVGAQFQHPYVFKKLFSNEEITFRDMCEPKSVVQGSMYLDFESVNTPMALETGHMKYIGKTGLFIPVTENGGILYRVKDDKRYAVTGTKGHLWVEAEVATQLELDYASIIDTSYFEKLVNEAFEAIDYFGSFADFVK